MTADCVTFIPPGVSNRVVDSSHVANWRGVESTVSGSEPWRLSMHWLAGSMAILVAAISPLKSAAASLDDA